MSACSVRLLPPPALNLLVNVDAEPTVLVGPLMTPRPSLTLTAPIASRVRQTVSHVGIGATGPEWTILRPIVDGKFLRLDIMPGTAEICLYRKQCRYNVTVQESLEQRLPGSGTA